MRQTQCEMLLKRTIRTSCVTVCILQYTAKIPSIRKNLMLTTYTQYVYCSHTVLKRTCQILQTRCPRESLNTASVVAVSLQVTTGRNSLRLGLQVIHVKTVAYTTAQTMEELIRMVMYVPLLCL